MTSVGVVKADRIRGHKVPAARIERWKPPLHRFHRESQTQRDRELSERSSRL